METRHGWPNMDFFSAFFSSRELEGALISLLYLEF